MLIHGNPHCSQCTAAAWSFLSSFIHVQIVSKGSKRGIEIMLCNVQYKYDRRQQSRRIAAGRKGIVSFVPTFF